MKMTKRLIAVVMVITMMLAMVNPITADAATKVKLSKTKATLTITDKKQNPSVTLKVKGTSKKAKWTTSNKKIATVKNGKVTAKAAGKVTITCKVAGRKLVCKITVVDKRAGLGVKIKTTKKSILDIEEPFHNVEVISNLAVVTYKGKDVTKKASYDLRKDSDKNVSTGFDDGYITEAGYKSSYISIGNNDYTLTVTYKNMKKVLKLKIKRERSFYYECYCGALFDNGDDLDAHGDANYLDYIQGKDEWTCDGCIINDYYKTTVTVK